MNNTILGTPSLAYRPRLIGSVPAGPTPEAGDKNSAATAPPQSTPAAFQPAPPLKVYPPSPSLLDWAKQAPIHTLTQLFQRSVNQFGDHDFLGTRVGDEYQYDTYKQAQGKVHDFASALIEHGFQPGDRLAIMAENSPHWVVADQGTYHAGGVVTSLYHTTAPETVEYEMQDSGSRYLMCATEKQLQTILSVEKNLPNLEAIIYTGKPTTATSTKKLWTMDDFMQSGHDNVSKNAAEIQKRARGLDATNIATIIYTSGTTGKPKGVMKSHGAMAFNVTSVLNRISGSTNDVQYSFLPLSHIFERAVCYGMMGSGAALAFCPSVHDYLKNIKVAHATIVSNVPAFFEGAYEKNNAAAAAALQTSSPIFDHKGLRWAGNLQKVIKQKLYHWAMNVQERQKQAEAKGEVSPMQEMRNEWAHRLVLDPAARKLEQKVGLQDVRLFICGGAKFKKEASQFFIDTGKRAEGTKWTMAEGYGMTEQLLTVNPPDHPIAGTVGKPIDGVELKFTEESEIVSRGPNMMNGYLNREDATAEAIDKDGRLHTGDMGAMDAQGHLHITGRIKDLLVLSSGKKVAPTDIEFTLSKSTYVQQPDAQKGIAGGVVLVGDDKPHVGALIVPRFEAFKDWAQAHGVAYDPVTLANHKDVKAMIKADVDRLCQPLSDYEKVGPITLLDHPLTVDNGEVVAGLLKLKRNVIKEKYKTQIDAMYPAKDKKSDEVKK